MIVAGQSKKVSPSTYRIGQGKATYFGPVITGFKHIAKSYGFYKDIKPYLPETYLDKYKYKPGKRITGYAGQIFHSKKRKLSSSYSKLNKECQHSKYWNCQRSN